jgi:hypothetical protein
MVIVLSVTQTDGYPVTLFNATPDHVGEPGGPRPGCPPFAATLYVNGDHSYSDVPEYNQVSRGRDT